MKWNMFIAVVYYKKITNSSLKLMIFHSHWMFKEKIQFLAIPSFFHCYHNSIFTLEISSMNKNVNGLSSFNTSVGSVFISVCERPLGALLMVAYSCGRWLLCSHCLNSYSGKRSMTVYIFHHVHSDWESTWEGDKDTDTDRERALVFGTSYL